MKTIDAVKMQRNEHTVGLTVGMALMALWTLWLM